MRKCVSTQFVRKLTNMYVCLCALIFVFIMSKLEIKKKYKI